MQPEAGDTGAWVSSHSVVPLLVILVRLPKPPHRGKPITKLEVLKLHTDFWCHYQLVFPHFFGVGWGGALYQVHC